MEERICDHFTVHRKGISESEMDKISPARLSWWSVNIGNDIYKEFFFETTYTSEIDPITLRCRRCGKKFSHRHIIDEVFNYIQNKTAQHIHANARKYSDSDEICRADPEDYARLLSYRNNWDHISRRISHHDFDKDAVYLRIGKEAAPTMFIEFPDGTKIITAVLEDPKYWRFINQEGINHD